MSGHLFITRGDLLHLHCDAILIPSGPHPETGAPGHLTQSWRGLELPVDGDGCLIDPPNEERRVTQVRRASKSNPAVWAAHSGDDREDPAWHARPFVDFIRGRKRQKQSPLARPLGEKRLLLGVPLLGAGRGGMADEKGTIVKAAVKAILDELRTADVDVVFVLVKDASYCAAQEARNRYQRGWSGLTRKQKDSAKSLAVEAQAGRLVLFLGAGVSMGAGLPSWKVLLADLSRRAKFTPAEQKELSKLDPRDAGAVLVARLGAPALRDAIAETVKGGHVSLMHQLLASLPTTEALTTNYDTLFEQAWCDAGRKPAVLPKGRRSSSSEWLVKLHGSIDDDNEKRPLVLSRGDYLRLEGSSPALAGIVQAMLLTRRLLFVGYSLSDDNFHRIIHQVRDTVAAASDPRHEPGQFGTVLTDQRIGLIDSLWEEDLEFVSTAEGRKGRRIRRVAIYLDYLAASTSAPAQHLMDPSFDAVFTDDEKALREALGQVKASAAEPKVRDGIQQAVDEALAMFGA